jgi:hypothetical protein
MFFLAIIIIILNFNIIFVIRGDKRGFFLKNTLHAYRSEMYHFSDGSTCGFEWNTSFRYSRILFVCLSFTVSFISPQMFHSLHQESVDSVDSCDTAVLREILISILEVKKRTVVSYVLQLCEKYQKISRSHYICNFKQHFIENYLLTKLYSTFH